MLRLDKALRAWGTPDFESVLKQEVAQAAGQLPLQQGLSNGSYVIDTPLTVMIQRVTELENLICVQAGIFYQGVIGGCSCADDPTPTGETTEYCVVRLEIDRGSAATTVILVEE